MASLADRLADLSPDVRSAAMRQVLGLALSVLDDDELDAFASVVIEQDDRVIALVADPSPVVRALACHTIGELATLPVHGEDAIEGAASLVRLSIRARSRIAEAVGDPGAVQACRRVATVLLASVSLAFTSSSTTRASGRAPMVGS